MNETARRDFLKQVSLAAATSVAVASVGQAESKKKRPIRVGQIGVGHAHASKLSVFRESPEFEVVGIVEPDDEMRQRAESQAAYRDLPWMTQEQLLNVPDLELVLVETHVRDLLNAAEACVVAGKHVHLDKPAGASLPHYRRILGEAAKNKLLVQMGYMYRYNPAVVLLRQMLREGWLGEVFELHAVMSKVIPAADRVKLAEFRGGVMFELGCHLMDLVVAILGKPLDVIPFPQHASSQADGLLDNGLAVLKYDRALATVKSTAMEVEGFARRHLAVCGSEGTFHIQPLDNPQAKLALSRPRGEYRQGYQDVRFPTYVRYVDDAADMARVIRGEKPSDFSYEHDLAVQEALLRACAMPLEE